MNTLSSLLILASILLVLAFTDAASLINEEPMIESTASDEIDSALRSKKEAGVSAGQHLIPSPLRRHHLKFGVLGKRYSYGYLGKRNNEALVNDEYEELLNELRERRAGRPQYGMLG